MAVPIGTAADFAALKIEPRGGEELDATTGVVTLPQGGTVQYKDEDVKVDAGKLRYLDGKFIEAKDATVSGAFGTITAPALRFDVAAQALKATRGATFKAASEGLMLAADAITVDLKEDTAYLAGNVSSSDPELKAEGAAVDLRQPWALLKAPYTFKNGPLSLSGEGGKTLALVWSAQGDVEAQTKPSAALAARLGGLLK